MVLRLLLIVLIVAGCSNDIGQNDVAVEAEVSGEDLFVHSCAACHGSDGTLKAGGASDLSVSKLSDEEIEDVIVNGRNTMQSQKYVFENDEEIDAVVEFVKELRK